MSTLTAAAAAKRKLSASVAADDESKVAGKKAKHVSEADKKTTEDGGSVDKSKANVNTSATSKKPVAPSHATFYFWFDAIQELLNGDVPSDQSVLRLKPEVLATWSKVKPYEEDSEKREDAIYAELDFAKQWHVEQSVDDEYGLNEDSAELAEEPEVDENGEETGLGDEYWWELDMQRDRPGAGVPALEVYLEGIWLSKARARPWEGTWWWTGLRPADNDGEEAMECFTEAYEGVLDGPCPWNPWRR
ncbi:hypothetical protein BC835DRAFT_1412452 [Cytidiella melzeri]|nr:hypothetical protein BC835DRAFT_1412452 [Cytidiella melzeri]